jgi:hypothetical protein
VRWLPVEALGLSTRMIARLIGGGNRVFRAEPYAYGPRDGHFRAAVEGILDV